jgi:YebC/PmpR family DNA-binding regulatory protein
MSGHSKWATIKHKKGATDKARGKQFAKLIKQVEVAARSGGGDRESNPTLRTMFQKARAASVPLDTIERAVKRGTGELEGVEYHEVNYEGYAPGGVAVYVETLTDNRNRTGPEMRSVFSKNGGSIAEPGAVAWQFERKGIVTVDGSVSEDDLMEAALEAGADDVSRADDEWHVIADGSATHEVSTALEAAGYSVKSAELTMMPTSLITIDSVETAKAVLRVIEALDDHDDVQEVYANFDIPDSLMAELE